MLTFNAAATALVIIDLQNGIVEMPLQPRSGLVVVANAMKLAQRFRHASSPVILVNVAWSRDYSDALRQPVDHPHSGPPGGFADGWSDIVDGLRQPGDILVTKHQWGAFFGTDLDIQLRRRGIRDIVLGGIATNIGVESTARQAWEHNYGVILAEDATASLTAEMHQFTIKNIFPLISRVTRSEEISFE